MCEFPGVQADVIGNDLAFAIQFPLVDQEAVEAYGASGVDFAGADTDFGAQAVTVAVASSPQQSGRTPAKAFYWPGRFWYNGGKA